MPDATKPMQLNDSLFRCGELQRGARACLAPAVAVFVFAFAMGALSHQYEWSAPYLILFCLGIVGASVQAISIQMWMPSHEFLPIFIACFVVHLRYVLICASIEHLLARLSLIEKLLAVHFTTDSNWVVTIAQQRRNQSVSSAFLFGGGLLIVGCYVLGNISGFLAAAEIGNIRRIGLDFAIPGVFLCLLISLWRSPRSDALPWGTAILISIASKAYIPGSWYIVLGAVSGASIAGLSEIIQHQRANYAK